MLTVIKFGGSSVSDAAKIDNAARIAKQIYESGERVVVVVSAQGKMTDRLMNKSSEICPSPDGRELDVLLSTGEEISVSLMAMKLISLGIPAVSLCGWQAGILTRGEHGKSKIKQIFTQRLEKELESGKIPVVAGFQGIDENEDITTIGRGGSDTTASALAAALGADSCIIYTDVSGVYSADPGEVPEAILHEEIGYTEMLEMAASGAGVLHDRSVKIAKNNKLKLTVASSFEKGKGTSVKDVIYEDGEVCGVVCDDSAALLRASGKALDYGFLHILFEKGINADLIFGGKDSVTLTVSKDDLKKAEKALYQALKNIENASVSYNDSVSKLSLVGHGLLGEPFITESFFSCLKDVKCEILSVFVSDGRICAVIPEKDGKTALSALHKLFLGK